MLTILLNAIFRTVHCNQLEHPSKILTQRFSMEKGFACYGDSGGPLVVEKNGNFVLVAITSIIPVAQLYISWPPSCFCCNDKDPEAHGRVSAALPWIYQVLEKKNLSIKCQRKT